MSEWQPIGTAPKDGTAILAAYDFNNGVCGQAVVRWTNYDTYPWEVICGDNALAESSLTHWMPLPELPMFSPTQETP